MEAAGGRSAGEQDGRGGKSERELKALIKRGMGVGRGMVCITVTREEDCLRMGRTAGGHDTEVDRARAAAKAA